LSACLDSWAVLAWLDGEQPAADRVDDLLPSRPVMSWVNAIEVYHRIDRDHGRAAADETLSELRSVIKLELPGVGRMTETAQLKSRLAIALGDCFAIATAAANKLPLLTGDPEIIESGDLPCAVEDLRQRGRKR
jgi:PIN domain nuclease of toxin-antitoxin system